MKKILIADGSEETRALIKFALNSAGYEVIEAENGDEALNKILLFHPDLVILDIGMPKLDGFSLTLQLRKNKETENLPIIISTGHGKLSELFLLNEIAKINDFIEKPFLPQEVIEKVNSILKKENPDTA